MQVHCPFELSHSLGDLGITNDSTVQPVLKTHNRRSQFPHPPFPTGSGSWINNISITWEPIRNADSQAPTPDLLMQKLWGGAQHPRFNKPSR